MMLPSGQPLLALVSFTDLSFLQNSHLVMYKAIYMLNEHSRLIVSSVL